MKNLTVGIFGGTFDPIHDGHLITTRYVLEQRKLDKIIFIPCNLSPHKTERVTTESVHRLNMLKLAIEQIPQFEYSDYEINKGEISFTYDTLTFLKKEYENLELIIGYDNLHTFHKWKMPDEILKIAKLVVMKRTTDKYNFHNKYFEQAIILDTPTIEISSTQIRERIKNNLPIDFLVPDKVKEYIFQNALYR